MKIYSLKVHLIRYCFQAQNEMITLNTAQFRETIVKISYIILKFDELPSDRHPRYVKPD